LYSKSANQLQEPPDGPSGTLPLLSISKVNAPEIDRELRRTLV
jgi:hypothetical protein